jgi:hypothetical protein
MARHSAAKAIYKNKKEHQNCIAFDSRIQIKVILKKYV